MHTSVLTFSNYLWCSPYYCQSSSRWFPCHGSSCFSFCHASFLLDVFHIIIPLFFLYVMILVLILLLPPSLVNVFYCFVFYFVSISFQSVSIPLISAALMLGRADMQLWIQQRAPNSQQIWGQRKLSKTMAMKPWRGQVVKGGDGSEPGLICISLWGLLSDLIPPPDTGSSIPSDLGTHTFQASNTSIPSAMLSL